MKTTQEIIGLRIISIADGTQLGYVKDVLLNSLGGLMDFLVVDQPSDYFGAKVIAFNDLLGIGEFAVTVPNHEVIQDVAQIPAVQDLLRQNVRVIGTKVLTKKGQLIGEVQELLIDEENGKITACLYRTSDGKDFEVGGDQVITFGKELLIVEANLPLTKSDSASTELAAAPQESFQESSQESQGEESASGTNNENGFNLFEQKQLQYFIGKTVEKEIVLDNGEVLLPGQPMLEDTIRKITRRSTLMEITTNLQK